MEGSDSGNSLSPQEIKVLITIERTGAGCSMVAIVLTVLSYVAFKRMRSTPNLFVICASLANAGASMASMMGYDGLKRGVHSDLCQAQAFIFEWFMQSDPWWSFAMALNVYLVFFHNADPATFRKYVWVYCLVCFGGPMIPAVVLISIRHDPRGLIFGDAALWCWISSDWSLVRLYAYYIPIWLCIFLSIAIYVLVGYHVFHHRNQLRHLAVEHWDKEANSYSGSGSRLSSDQGVGRVANGEESPRPDFYGTAVTEVRQITSEANKTKYSNVPTLPPLLHCRGSPGRVQSWAHPNGEEENENVKDRKTQRFETVCTAERAFYSHPSVMNRLKAAKSSASLKLKRLDPVKMAYLRTSFIFGFAVLITWIPSSINRLFSLTHNNDISFSLSVASGCVLPLQGVWNALIYFSTSWGIVSEELVALRKRLFDREKPKAPIRLDSRLDTFMGDSHRNTFDRARLPNSGFMRCEIDHIELDESCDYGRSTK